jgi:hypothetical protein
MTSYLSPETIRDAVARLGESRAQSALVDYLIFKRALVLANQDATRGDVVSQVKTGTKAEHFVAAIEELTGVADASDSSRPYFSPFGSRRDTGRGYKSKKYPSNGSSDTVSRWGSRPDRPLEVVPGTSPKEFVLVPRSADELARFFLIDGAAANSSGKKPYLSDLAIWWLRDTDLDATFDSEPDLDALVEVTTKDLDLSPTEIAGLFETDPHSVDAAVTLAPTPAPSDTYLPVPPTQSRQAPVSVTAAAVGQLDAGDVDSVIDYVTARGFVFDPWQVAAFITAARVKPFVILAGISGTGKTKLPRLVAEATGAQFRRVPVRPDWTDSSELLGYERLDGTFVPGYLLQVAREAIENPDQQFFALLDEMNVARVEYYLAEVLSHLEERSVAVDGSIRSDPLAPAAPADWRDIYLPGNLCLVGSVNMDETTFGFSRKVLDRSFVIEFSTVSLSVVNAIDAVQEASNWDVARWRPVGLTLSEHPLHSHEDVGRVITALETINKVLTPVQMQVGYRVRDEIALFVLGAHDCAESFVSEDEAVINPLDLAIAMKVLPRIQGSGPAIRQVLDRLMAWADPTTSEETTTGLSTESFPFCADRLAMMRQRLDDTGFTSYWL